MDAPSASSRAHEQLKIHNNHHTKIYPTNLENLLDKIKITVLTQTFPGIRHSNIKRALNKCKGKVAHAIDVLLDQIFLKESSESRPRVNYLKENMPNPLPSVRTGKKAPVVNSSGPKGLRNTARRFRRHGKFKSGSDRRFRTTFDHPKGATRRFIKKPLVKTCIDKGQGSARDLLSNLNVPAGGKRKDPDKDDSKATGMRRRKGKGNGKDDGKDGRES